MLDHVLDNFIDLLKVVVCDPSCHLVLIVYTRNLL